MGYQTTQLTSKAKTASDSANNIVNALKTGDYATANANASQLCDAAQYMDKTLSQPQWAMACALPEVGGDIASVRSLVSILNDCAQNAVKPTFNTLQATPLNTIVTKGKINLPALQQLLDCVSNAAVVVKRNEDRINAIGEFTLQPLKEKVNPLLEKLRSFSQALQVVSEITPYAYDLLGGNGVRTYLIAAQNSSEIRSTCGFIGALSTVTFNNGAFDLGDFGRPYELLEEETVGVEIDDNELMIFGDWVTRARDTGYDPNFPFSANAWQISYENRNGTNVDGVISMTPTIIQDLLGIVGPITISDGTTLDGTNATKIIEHDLYWTYMNIENYSQDADVTDDLFAEIAEKTFDKLFDNINTSTLFKILQAMATKAEERSLFIWMDDSLLQNKLEELDCTGALKTNAGSCEVGVYFCATGNKLGWNTDITTNVARTINADGTMTYNLTSTFVCNLSEEEIANASHYIGGIDCSLHPSVYIYAPAGVSFDSFSANFTEAFTPAVHNGLNMYYDNDNIHMAVGHELIVVYSFTVPAGSPELTVRTTPTLTKYRLAG